MRMTSNENPEQNSHHLRQKAPTHRRGATVNSNITYESNNSASRERKLPPSLHLPNDALADLNLLGDEEDRGTALRAVESMASDDSHAGRSIPGTPPRLDPITPLDFIHDDLLIDHLDSPSAGYLNLKTPKDSDWFPSEYS